MNIFVEVRSALDATGKACWYYPTAHWELNDEDTATPEQMNALKDELNAVLAKHFTGVATK